MANKILIEAIEHLVGGTIAELIIDIIQSEYAIFTNGHPIYVNLKQRQDLLYNIFTECFDATDINTFADILLTALQHDYIDFAEQILIDAIIYNIDKDKLQELIKDKFFDYNINDEQQKLLFIYHGFINVEVSTALIDCIRQDIYDKLQRYKLHNNT